MIKALKLDSVSVPYLAAYDLRCNYEPMSREVIHPMADGGLIKQVFSGTQNKLRSILSGSGNIPPGMDGLDTSVELLFSSAAELSIVSTATSITLPAERRTDADYLPWGRALVGDRWQTTPVVMTVDQADLTPVAGAVQYQVLWYPEFMVLTDGGRPSVLHDVHGAVASWQLVLLQA